MPGMSKLEKLMAIIRAASRRPLGSRISDRTLCLNIYADVASIRAAMQ